MERVFEDFDFAILEDGGFKEDAVREELMVQDAVAVHLGL